MQAASNIWCRTKVLVSAALFHHAAGPPPGGGEGPGYTVVDDNKGCFFKKSPKMATFQSYARVCAVVKL